MTEYTPVLEEVRDRYQDGRIWDGPAYDDENDMDAPRREFDRWLAAHDAEVAAKALEDAADEAETATESRGSLLWAMWLTARAAALRESTGGENHG